MFIAEDTDGFRASGKRPAKALAFLTLLTCLCVSPIDGQESAKSGESPTFTLMTELQFAGRKVSGIIRQTEIEDLLTLPVRNGVSETVSDQDEKFGVELRNDSGQRKRVRACAEWKRFVDEGWFSETTFDMAMESFLIRTCEALFALQKAKTPKVSYLSGAGLGDLGLLPAEVLIEMYDGEEEAPKTEPAARRLSVDDLVRNGKAIMEEKKPHQIAVTFGGVSQRLTELARADFNGDGIEDIFVFSGSRVVDGTMGFAFNLLLTRRGPEARFELLKLE